MPSPIINLSALEPLYLPHEMPTHHRVRAEQEGEPAEKVKGRRPSEIQVAQNLRRYVTEWRESDYIGASDTTRELLYHWFGRDHAIKNSDGDIIPFKYYFCQREAIETFIFLREVRVLDTLSGIVSEFGGENREIAALGIDPEEDQWAKYAFKIATGAGKTKIMSLAIVWSYFHVLRESYSPMSKHFVVVAPNLTVFERLKEDFGDGLIFDKDPLIPNEWKGDWNLSVVLQDDAGGAATGGILYLTNIHRLYDVSKRKKKDAETYDWMGPAVSKAKALDTGEVLRERITSHKRIMVLNDEAHHLWDPDSAWNEAITFLNDTIRKRGGEGLISQLDFSATPKDNEGNIFKHVVCDAPLGEAVDGGIVKTPIIGRGEKLIEQTSDDASVKYQHHIMMGYARWLKSKEEWEKSSKKALMFVMTEDTESASQIANKLNTDPLYKELNGKTVNLHTRLKGKLKPHGRGENIWYEFIENEKEISDEDLKELRKLSRELDSNKSPYLCIVSVLMLREGWDVRNVTTIVPLRPYSSKANILPEQTLGRGLRRMTLPGEGVAEVVTVVEHKAFVNLYKDQLSQEGLPIEVVDVDKVPKTTVTVYPDKTKDLDKLDIQLPALSAGYKRTPKLENIAIEDVKKAFSRYQPLPLGKVGKTEIDYEGRHLFTNEIIEKMKIQLPLLQSGIGAISFYREEIEKLTSLRGTHQVLAPLIQTFLEEILFERKVSIFDEKLIIRLSDADVREHIRATFVPLIRSKTTFVEERMQEGDSVSVCNWKPFQVTHSENRPAIPADNTPFNLVPCNREFEVAMTTFLNRASDIQSFCKNAGPQALRIDYMTGSGRLAFYTPDFMVKKKDGNYLLVETKGREDIDVPLKAMAAVSWCKAASSKKTKWVYLYVPQAVFSGAASNQVDDLVRACAPSLQDLLREKIKPQLSLPLGDYVEGKVTGIEEFIKITHLEKLPSRYKKSIEQAVALFQFFEKKEEMSFAPVFTPLLGPLDESAKGIINDLLLPLMPGTPTGQKDFFEPYYENFKKDDIEWLRRHASNLRRTLVFKNGLWPSGLLLFCLGYCRTSKHDVGGVFEAIKQNFSKFNDTDLYDTVKYITDFRNTYIAHQEKELYDINIAREGLLKWVQGLYKIYFAHH